MTIIVEFTPSPDVPAGISWKLYEYNNGAGTYQLIGTTTTPQVITTYYPYTAITTIQYQTQFGNCSIQDYNATVTPSGVNVVYVSPVNLTASCLNLPQYYNVTVKTGNTVQYFLPVSGKPYNYSLNTSVVIELNGQQLTTMSGNSVTFTGIPAGSYNIQYYYPSAAPTTIPINVSGNTTITVQPNAAPYLITVGNVINYQGDTTSTPYPVTITGIMNGQTFSGTISNESSYFFSPLASGKNTVIFGFSPSSSISPSSICTIQQTLPVSVEISDNVAIGTEVSVGMTYSCALSFPTFVPPTNVTLNIIPNSNLVDGVSYTVSFPAPISQSTSATVPNTASITFPESQIPSNDTINFSFQYSGCSSPSNGSGKITSGAGVYPLDLPYLSCAAIGSAPPPPAPPTPTIDYLYYLIGGLAAVGAAVGGIAYFKGKAQSGMENKFIQLLSKAKPQSETVEKPEKNPSSVSASFKRIIAKAQSGTKNKVIQLLNKGGSK